MFDNLGVPNKDEGTNARPRTRRFIGSPKLYDLIEAGKLRSYQIGRAHRVSEQAVADCIALLELESAQERAARSPLPAGSRRPLAG